MTKMFGLPKYIPMVGEVLDTQVNLLTWEVYRLVYNPLYGFAFVTTDGVRYPRYGDCVWYETLEAAKLAREMAK